MRRLSGTEIINYQDKLYYIYRRFPENQIKEGCINNVKELWNCDVVLRKKNEDNDILLFLVEISDAIIIEDDDKEITKKE